MVTIDDMNKFPEKEMMRKVLYNQLYFWTQQNGGWNSYQNYIKKSDTYENSTNNSY